MDKTAQKRKLKHKARRGVNFTGKALEALNSEFRSVIKNMEKVDTAIRKDAENLQFFVKEARSLVRRREYLTAATVLTNFHEQVKRINTRLQGLNRSINVKHYQFLLKQIREVDKARLFNYEPDKEIELEADDGLIVEAGLVADWWHNIFNQQARAMKALENKFSAPFLVSLKEETTDMVVETENFFKSLAQKFDELGSAWATRDVGAYLGLVSDFSQEYNSYHKTFVKYYTKNVLPFKEEQNKINEAAKAEEAAQLAKRDRHELENAPTTPHPVWAPNTSPTTLTSPVKNKLELPLQSGPQSAMPGEKDPFDTTPEQAPSVRAEPSPSTLRSPVPSQGMGDKVKGWKHTNKKSHREFITSLEKLSSTQEMLSELLEYSEQLDNDGNSEDSLKLLAIAEGLVEKKAGIFDFFDRDHADNDNSDKKKDQKEVDPLKINKKRFIGIYHKIPEGMSVHKKWSQIPFLSKINPSQLKLSSGTADHIIRSIVKVLYHNRANIDDVGMGFESRLIDAIKKAIPIGILQKNMVCGEGANPRDCYLDTFTYIKLNEVDPALQGICKFVAVCRLGSFDGSISVVKLRNIEIV